MPRKDKDEYREYMKDQMRRRRAEKKDRESAVVISPVDSKPSATASRLTSGRESISDKAAQSFIYMETNLGRTKIVDTIVFLTMKQLEKPGWALWYHQRDGKIQPLVICQDESIRNSPKCPKDIPDFILDNSWDKDDIRNLLLSLLSPTGKGAKN